MKIAKIFATGISGDIRSEFTVYNVKVEKAESAYITIAYLKDKLMF